MKRLSTLYRSIFVPKLKKRTKCSSVSTENRRGPDTKIKTLNHLYTGCPVKKPFRNKN